MGTGQEGQLRSCGVGWGSPGAGPAPCLFLGQSALVSDPVKGSCEQTSPCSLCFSHIEDSRVFVFLKMHLIQPVSPLCSSPLSCRSRVVVRLAPLESSLSWALLAAPSFNFCPLCCPSVSRLHLPLSGFQEPLLWISEAKVRFPLWVPF